MSGKKVENEAPVCCYAIKYNNYRGIDLSKVRKTQIELNNEFPWTVKHYKTIKVEIREVERKRKK